MEYDVIEIQDMDAFKRELCWKLDQLPADAQESIARQLVQEELIR